MMSAAGYEAGGEEVASSSAIKVRLSVGFWLMAAIAAFCTLGVMALYLLWLTRSWVKLIDDEGLILRNGKRFPWKDLSRVYAVTVRHTTGIRLTGRVELLFAGGDKVRIVPFSTGNSEEVLAFLSTKVGSKVSV